MSKIRVTFNDGSTLILEDISKLQDSGNWVNIERIMPLLGEPDTSNSRVVKYNFKDDAKDPCSIRVWDSSIRMSCINDDNSCVSFSKAMAAELWPIVKKFAEGEA